MQYVALSNKKHYPAYHGGKKLTIVKSAGHVGLEPK
jgi:hypothetical protein